MKTVLKSPAKINLCLDILGKTNDGYHNLKMIMQAISLFDTIYFEIKKATKDLSRKIELECNYSFIPTDDRNLIVKVIKYFIDKYDINDNFYVNLEKMIPTCGGLGGGSSDAASTILFINDYYKLNLDIKSLIEIANLFGSDIPFFIEKGISICEGKGEIVTKLNCFNGYYIIIATPNIRISTKDIFDKYDEVRTDSANDNSAKFRNCVEAIKNKDIGKLSENVFNELQVITEGIVPEISVFRHKMLEMGAINSLMSGSGPSVFGIFKSYFKALNCKNALKKQYKEAFVYIARPI